MNTLVAILVWVAAISSATLTVYWMIIYPVIARSSALRINRIQDEVRLSVLDHDVSGSSRAYHEFEWFLNIARTAAKNPATFVLSRRKILPHELADIQQRMDHIMDGGEPIIINAFERLTSTVFLLQLSIRPAHTFCIVMLAFGALFSQMAKSLLSKSELEAYALARNACAA